jgi:hypothetical protein
MTKLESQFNNSTVQQFNTSTTQQNNPPQSPFFKGGGSPQ